MPRALRIRRVAAPPADRDAALAALRARRDVLRGRGCHVWLFEDPSPPGAFVEFIEAGDAALLAAALADEGADLASSPILTEVET